MGENTKDQENKIFLSILNKSLDTFCCIRNSLQYPQLAELISALNVWTEINQYRSGNTIQFTPKAIIAVI